MQPGTPCPSQVGDGAHLMLPQTRSLGAGAADTFQWRWSGCCIAMLATTCSLLCLSTPHKCHYTSCSAVTLTLDSLVCVCVCVCVCVA